MGIPENLTLKEAIKFIVERVDKPNEKDQRAWENLIRTRFKRGVTEDKNGKYTLNEILVHALKHYGLESFKDLPLPSINISGGSSYLDDLIGTGSIITFSVPNNLEECKALISELHTEIYQLKEEIKQRDGEIERLKPLADKYRKICAKNQNSARKKR